MIKLKEDQYRDLNSLYDEHYVNHDYKSYELAKASYLKGAQSQQAIIDELQARIDGALNTLCKLQYSSGERIYSDVGSILKGNKDEN